MGVWLQSGLREGVVDVPPSKSHAHRLLIADFLAGDFSRLVSESSDSADICATKRCLRALLESSSTPVLDCGESGSTRRFLAPIAVALGKHPVFKTAGHLASRPMRDYESLTPGTYLLPGNVSSQFATGLLFALPLLKGDSSIRFSTPLLSRGYVDVTLQVLAGAGIRIVATQDGFDVPGGQTYRAQSHVPVEGDWSGAAFWLAMNALGSCVQVRGLNASSAQPDRVVADLLPDLPRAVDVTQFPDSFPVLAVVAARRDGVTHFVGMTRLRIKECDRVEATRLLLKNLGVEMVVTGDTCDVQGRVQAFRPQGMVATFADHRIAMASAVAATVCEGPLEIDNATCCAKSYPGFFEVWNALRAVKSST